MKELKKHTNVIQFPFRNIMEEKLNLNDNFGIRIIARRLTY